MKTIKAAFINEEATPAHWFHCLPQPLEFPISGWNRRQRLPLLPLKYIKIRERPLLRIALERIGIRYKADLPPFRRVPLNPARELPEAHMWCEIAAVIVGITRVDNHITRGGSEKPPHI